MKQTKYEGYKQILVSLRNRTAGEEDGKTLVRDKRDRAITWECCRGLPLSLMFSGLFFQTKIIVTLVTQGLPSSFLSRPVA